MTRNGKIIAKLSSPYQDRVEIAKSLFGVLSDEMTLEVKEYMTAVINT